MVRVALPSVQCARAVAAVRASRAVGFPCAGHNGFRTCSTTATAVPFQPGDEIAGLSPNISVKRTPVNRLRSSKGCGRRRLPQALGARGSLNASCCHPSCSSCAWRLCAVAYVVVAPRRTCPSHIRSGHHARASPVRSVVPTARTLAGSKSRWLVRGVRYQPKRRHLGAVR